ncbi:MAG: hypothetical protein IPJ13_01000 [Saprospiraceae bacterium]|nr:hypothetical protein [Saprospiraceae bacterium]
MRWHCWNVSLYEGMFYKTGRFNRKIFLWATCFILILSSCSTSKNIPDNDALYTGSIIDISQTEFSSKHKKSFIVI